MAQEMVTVHYEGKPLSMPLDVVKAGIPAIKAAVAASGFPMVENAQITIDWPKDKGAPPRVNISPRSTPKGAPIENELDYSHFINALIEAPEYVNPAIALATQVIQAESTGDQEFFERAARSGLVEKAVSEGQREGKAVFQCLAALGHVVPQYSKEVPVGF
jgi:hypothetical protein